MKIKTSELIDNALDWAVELAKGTHWSHNGYFVYNDGKVVGGVYPFSKHPKYPYSALWAQGGPIIERECLALECIGHCWEAYTMIEVADEDFLVPQSVSQTGPTPLIAAMRCFVASKLGDEVDVPEELL